MTDGFESTNFEDNRNTTRPAGQDGAGAAPAADGKATPSAGAGHDLSCPDKAQRQSADRRKRRRAMISAPVRIRARDVTQDGPDEITTTLDVSRNGVLFASSLTTFAAGMEVAVTFPYSKTPPFEQAEQSGRVVRVSELPDGRQSVAIALGVGVGEDIVDAAGRTLVSGERNDSCAEPLPGDDKPLVLVVDGDQAVRQSLKALLRPEGYDVIAVSCASEGREVLQMFTPALLIAEIEGEDLPGYDLCAHCKTTPRLQTVPVTLLTSSAYPSDYANAHSLGAVVCMAKPYRPERMAHIVRLLAPTKEAKAQAAPARAADPSRRASRGRTIPNRPVPERRRWRF